MTGVTGLVGVVNVLVQLLVGLLDMVDVVYVISVRMAVMYDGGGRHVVHVITYCGGIIEDNNGSGNSCSSGRLIWCSCDCGGGGRGWGRGYHCRWQQPYVGIQVNFKLFTIINSYTWM